MARMIIEETTFRSLLAIAAGPTPAPIHKYKDAYFALAHIGDCLYIAIARDGPKENAPFVEYDKESRKWKLLDPAKEDFSRSPMIVPIAVAEVKDLKGDMGKKIKSALSG